MILNRRNQKTVICMVENTKQNQVPEAGNARDASGINGKFQPKALLTEGIGRKITLQEFRDIIRKNANYSEKHLFDSDIQNLKTEFSKRNLPLPTDEQLAKLENLKKDGDEVFLRVDVKDEQSPGGRTDIFNVRMAGEKLSVYGGSNALSAALDQLRFMKKTEFLSEELARSFSMILNRIINSEKRATMHSICPDDFLCIVYNENFDIGIMPLLTKLAEKYAGGGLQYCYHFISPQMEYQAFPQALPLYERLVECTAREIDPNDPIWAGDHQPAARKAMPTKEAFRLVWDILATSDSRSFSIIMKILDNVPGEALAAAFADGSYRKYEIAPAVKRMNDEIKALDNRRPGWEKYLNYKAMAEEISKAKMLGFDGLDYYSQPR